MDHFTFVQKIRNKIKIKDKNCTFELGDNIKIVNSRIYIKGNNNKLTIKNDTVIRNATIEIIGDNCQIYIGNNCMIGDNCYLSTKETDISLIINDNCGLSRNVKVMTSDGHHIYQNSKIINKAKDIIINHDVWIADNVTILKGVSIGANSVVGIDSVVTKSSHSNTVLAGNPAKIVKENITWKA